MRPLVVGLGHSLREDDAAGLWCIEILQNYNRPLEVDLLKCTADLLQYIHLLHNRAAVVLIDAVDGGLPAGSRIRRRCRPDRSYSNIGLDTTDSHGTNLRLSLAVMRRLYGQIPEIVLYGIQPAETGFRLGLCPLVAKACQILTQQILTDCPWSSPDQRQDVTWISGLQIMETGVDRMHGFDWMRAALALVDDAARQGNLSRISRLRIGVGELSGYPIDELKLAFDCLKTDTVCQDARLELEITTPLASCQQCGSKEVEWQKSSKCSLCGGPLHLVGGKTAEVLEVEGT